MRILLDTDIGDDIDDAFALALALRLPEVELVGVTTVFRDVQARARMARYILDLFGRQDVPVYAGAGRPLLGPDPGVVRQAQLDLTPEQVVGAAAGHAVDFIRRTYAEAGSDVTLVTIGGLTNLALALALDPELARRIPRVVAMGGNFRYPKPEWNILCDAEASAIVVRSGVPLTLVPFDVTQQTATGPEHMAALAASPDEHLRWIMTLRQAWQVDKPYLPVLHDPLALAVAVEPGWVRTERVGIEVLTAPGPGRGITCLVDDGPPFVDVAVHADGPGFAAWFVQTLTGRSGTV